VHDPKLYVDQYCEVHDLLTRYFLNDFVDFESVTIRKGAVYVLGRDTMIHSAKKIRSIVESNLAHIVFSNPAEGSSTMLGQFERFSVSDLIESGKIMILSGGDLDSRYRYFQFDNFFYRMMQFDENVAAMNRSDEIYTKTEKPYTFLMLNGRIRPHRKWILQKLRDTGLLDQALYTNLHARNAPNRTLTYIVNGHDLMHEIEPVHYLPAEYEVDQYQYQVNTPCTDIDVKHHLFKSEWGEAYIKPEPYIDTYFSIVNETIYEAPHTFRTEKIWKPIIMGHPWICLSNSGFYRDLRNMGFQTFETIIDESFDNITNPQLRIERTSVIIQELCRGNLKQFLAESQSICKYNQQVLLELRPRIDTFPQQFIDFLRENTQ
jgi:hypothetical protein